MAAVSVRVCLVIHPKGFSQKFIPKLGMATPENIAMLETGNIVCHTLDEKMHRLRGRSDHMFCSMTSSPNIFLEPVWAVWISKNLLDILLQYVSSTNSHGIW